MNAIRILSGFGSRDAVSIEKGWAPELSLNILI